MTKKEALYKEIVEMMEELSEDTSLPRNIRRGIAQARDVLTNEKNALDVRVASAIFALDEIANDPNIPVHGRTMVYMIMGKLETLSKEISS
ncbi:MAG TPA: UPF0147 family protein [Candidatus Aciduliprofundum boonei]|uniref:UPF0147 protein ENL31_00540 n=1 Tax=Candidatus Aciduliprofundum boonei TaxID=379547 RepID=A0A7J3TAK9_9ARCH|nr:UPF0147 family protein [Thermoplasmata archaeon]HHE75598.1 UPF0147 family protein [Candidatus Aciduliprofundum boonei]